MIKIHEDKSIWTNPDLFDALTFFSNPFKNKHIKARDLNPDDFTEPKVLAVFAQKKKTGKYLALSIIPFVISIVLVFSQR